MRIRQSAMSKQQRCRRAHHLRYVNNVVPVSIGPRRPASGQRDAGSAAHVGVEHINLGGSVDEALVKVTEYINELRAIRNDEELVPLTKEHDEEWWKVERLAHAMTTNYVEWLAEGNDVGIQIWGVEEAWEVPIPGMDRTMYGMIDLWYYDPLIDGMVVRDNKSVAAFNQTPTDVDFQLRTYAWALWRTSGVVPKRAEHLMMKRVLGTGNAKPPFFETYPIKITERILRSHEAHLVERAKVIHSTSALAADDPKLWPNPTKDCSWDCDYKDLCPMMDDGSDWEYVLESDFVLVEDGE